MLFGNGRMNLKMLFLLLFFFKKKLSEFIIHLSRLFYSIIVDGEMFDNECWSVVDISCSIFSLNPLSANPTKWSNTLKQFVCSCRRMV